MIYVIYRIGLNLNLVHWNQLNYKPVIIYAKMHKTNIVKVNLMVVLLIDTVLNFLDLSYFQVDVINDFVVL